MKLTSSKIGLFIGLVLMTCPMALTLILTGSNRDEITKEQRLARAEVEEDLSVIEEKAEEAKAIAAAEEKQEAPKQNLIAKVIKDRLIKPKAETKTTIRVPVFAGFEHERFQRHDALIAKFVEAFNRNPAAWAGATSVQAGNIRPITAAQIKSHMIQETGGADAKSRAAWKKDPLQANVPGDWSTYKKYVGLHKPRNRNEGSLEANLKAGIMILVRKGFSESGQPAANRPKNSFTTWRRALQRYNGRKDLTVDGVPYRDVYASRILKRAESPKSFVDIPIKKKKRAKRR